MASLFAAFEDVERLVARTVTEAASAVVESTSEFPKPNTEATRHPQLVVPVSTAHAVHQAKKAQTSWEDFEWQVGLIILKDIDVSTEVGSQHAQTPAILCCVVLCCVCAHTGPATAVAGCLAAAAAEQHRWCCTTSCPRASGTAADAVRAAAVTARPVASSEECSCAHSQNSR